MLQKEWRLGKRTPASAWGCLKMGIWCNVQTNLHVSSSHSFLQPSHVCIPAPWGIWFLFGGLFGTWSINDVNKTKPWHAQLKPQACLLMSIVDTKKLLGHHLFSHRFTCLMVKVNCWSWFLVN
jgi:hypothetical protein